MIESEKSMTFRNRTSSVSNDLSNTGLPWRVDYSNDAGYWYCDYADYWIVAMYNAIKYLLTGK